MWSFKSVNKLWMNCQWSGVFENIEQDYQQYLNVDNILVLLSRRHVDKDYCHRNQVYQSFIRLQLNSLTVARDTIQSERCSRFTANISYGMQFCLCCWKTVTFPSTYQGGFRNFFVVLSHRDSAFEKLSFFVQCSLLSRLFVWSWRIRNHGFLDASGSWKTF